MVAMSGASTTAIKAARKEPTVAATDLRSPCFDNQLSSGPSTRPVLETTT
jgi:hypothetical protein